MAMMMRIVNAPRPKVRYRSQRGIGEVDSLLSLKEQASSRKKIIP